MKRSTEELLFKITGIKFRMISVELTIKYLCEFFLDEISGGTSAETIFAEFNKSNQASNWDEYFLIIYE